jgi:hypothetical protein
MPQYQSLLAGRGPTVIPLHDLDIRPANADGHCLHEDRALTLVRF